MLDSRRRKLSLCFTSSNKINDWKVKQVIRFLKDHKITYKIFRLPKLDITNKEDLDVLLDYLQSVNNKFIRFTTINFDNAKLETNFHKKYSDYLKDEGFEGDLESIFKYFSSKGVMLYLDKFENVIVDHESVVPKTLACVIISQSSVIKPEDREKIPEELRKTIKTLAINYIKGVDNYVQMCRQILTVVEWFEQIDEIKFSLPSTAPIVLGNIMKNFYQKVSRSIEVKTIYSKKTGSDVVARNSLMMMAYIHPTKNEKVKDYYNLKKVSFTTDVGIDKKASEEWMKILNPDKVKFEFYPLEERLNEEIKDIYDTSYRVDFDNQH